MTMAAGLDRIASDVADRVIRSSCERRAKTAIADSLFEALGYCRNETRGRRRRPRRPNWVGRDRFLAPYEKRLKKSLTKIWDSERRVVLANMRKFPLTRAIHSISIKENPIIDGWIYASSRFKGELSAQTRRVLSSLLSGSIPRTIESLDLNLNFDIVNEHALSWLNEHVIGLSEKLEEINISDLKNTLLEGIDAGEAMRDLTNRVNELFEEYDKTRAETIARTETIRAQEQGNLEVYKEAGFKRKIWFANPDCCELCEELDNKDIPIDEPYFSDSYGDGMAPPRHPRCRCGSGPYEEGW